MKDEIVYVLPNKDKPITARRLTSEFFSPYSLAKSEEIRKHLEILLVEGKVFNSRIPYVNDIGWYTSDECRFDLKIDDNSILRFLEKFAGNQRDISLYIEREVLKCIRNSAQPITNVEISRALSYLNKFLKIVILESILLKLESENKIRSLIIKFDITAWRIFNPRIDKIFKFPRKTEKPPKILPQGLNFSKDNKTLYINIFSISSNEKIKICNEISRHKGIIEITDLAKIKKPFFLNDTQALILSHKKISYYNLSNVQSFLEKLPSTPGHHKLAKKIIHTQSEYNYIYMDELTDISDEVAIIFSRFKGGLIFPKIRILSDRSAQALASLKDPDPWVMETESWKLYLDGFLDLNLSGLEEISCSPGHIQLAEKLARQSSLELPDLQILSTEAATILLKHDGPISLNGMKSISDSCASQLSMHAHDLNFESLEVLSNFPGHVKLAEKLASQQSVKLPKLRSLSSEAAATLSLHKGSIELGEIEQISDECAEQLSRCVGYLRMPSLKPLSGSKSHINLGTKLLKQKYDANGDVKKDEFFSSCTVSKVFKKITPDILNDSFISRLSISLKQSIIDDKLADALCAHKGKIELCNLKVLTDNPSNIRLCKRLAIQEIVHLNKITGLSVLSASALSEALELYLDGLRAVDKKLSSVLSKNCGIISLNGIQELCSDSALEFSNHAGILILNGLATLSDTKGHTALAEKLIQQGSINLPSLKYLSAKAADFFCECPGDILLPYSILGKSPEHLQLRIKISKQSFLLP